MKSTVKTSSGFTLIEGATDSTDTTLTSGIRVRYGYPFATQTNLKLVADFT